MANFIRRVQTILTEKQYRALIELATKLGKPVSVLIREAIEKVYFEEAARKQRLSALQDLLSLEAPVSDWPEMEEEIMQGAQEKSIK